MKKIALILAVVLMLSFALVACDNTEESKAPATSDTVSTDTSVEESTEVSEEESTEVSEEVSEEESTVIEPAEVGEVISVGKTYTLSNLFRQSPETWGWDENCDVAYPDEEGVSLTDGVKLPTEESYQDAVWAGFNGNGTPDFAENGYSWIKLDLGEKKDISLIELTVGTSKLGSGIGAANFTVEFLVSEDGETWTSLGTEVAVDSTDVITTDIAKATNVSAQYVEVHLVRSGWMFVSELTVYDVAAE
jgi:hypothetical protein